MENSLLTTEAEVKVEQRLARRLSAANAVAQRLMSVQKAFDFGSEIYGEQGFSK